MQVLHGGSVTAIIPGSWFPFVSNLGNHRSARPRVLGGYPKSHRVLRGHARPHRTPDGMLVEEGSSSASASSRQILWPATSWPGERYVYVCRQLWAAEQHGQRSQTPQKVAVSRSRAVAKWRTFDPVHLVRSATMRACGVKRKCPGVSRDVHGQIGGGGAGVCECAVAESIRMGAQRCICNYLPLLFY